MSEEYTVSLTFKQWMDICHALGYVTSAYREKGMTGQANRYSAINGEIAEGLTDD